MDVEQIKEGLTHKYGPLPLWGWSAIALVGLFWWRAKHNATSPKSAGTFDYGQDYGFSQGLGSGGGSNNAPDGSGAGDGKGRNRRERAQNRQLRKIAKELRKIGHHDDHPHKKHPVGNNHKHTHKRPDIGVKGGAKGGDYHKGADKKGPEKTIHDHGGKQHSHEGGDKQHAHNPSQQNPKPTRRFGGIRVPTVPASNKGNQAPMNGNGGHTVTTKQQAAPSRPVKMNTPHASQQPTKQKIAHPGPKAGK